MPLVEDISALRGMPLKELTIGGRGGNAVLSDLEPLRGLPLRKLKLIECKQVQNLEPLRGMRLTYLNLNSSSCFDLEPLTGMPRISCRSTSRRRAIPPSPPSPLPPPTSTSISHSA